MVEVGTRSLPIKVQPKKKPNQKKNSTVSDRELNSLSITVEFFGPIVPTSKYLFVVAFPNVLKIVPHGHLSKSAVFDRFSHISRTLGL